MSGHFLSEELHPETSLLLIICQLAAPARGHCLNEAASPRYSCPFFRVGHRVSHPATVLVGDVGKAADVCQV